MEQIKSYIYKIPDYSGKSSGTLIKYFAYFLIKELCYLSFTAQNICFCFEALNIKPYSNISSFLSSNSKGKDPLFLKSKSGGYVISRKLTEIISKEMDDAIDIPASNELMDLSIFVEAPYYIKANANQMARCYDLALYDATLVLMRKLFETLIIECYERYGIDAEIKDTNGVFYFLSDLITKYILSSKWNVSRNLEDSIKKVKKYGDLSAHNRRFLAKKKDIDDFKFDLRQCAQEILLTIDYHSWNK